MDITLIYLDTRRGKSHTPLGLGYLAAYLDAADHKVDIMACETFHYDRGHILKRIYDSKTKVFGITAMFHELGLAREMTRYIKSIKPEALVILGGILATTTPEFALHKTGADIAVKGEAELTIVEVMNYLENGVSDLTTIPGLVLREGKHETVDTGKEKIIEDISNIKWPKIDAFPYSRLMAQSFYPQDTGCVVGDMITSRGCPFKCNFCYSVSKPRYRPVGDVIDELQFMKRRYGVNTITFMDETFAVSKRRVEEMCSAIITESLDIKFSTTSRANILTKETAEMLYKAGCRTINIGLESGDQDMLDRMHKQIKVEDTTQAIHNAREAGIFVEYPCMVGNIGETPDSMKRTFELLKELTWGDFQWRIPFFCTPYPGTEIYDYALEKGMILDIEDFYQKYQNMNQLSINLTEMQTDEFLKLYQELTEDLKRHYYKALPKWKPTPF